ncbi:MAG: DNA-binding protein [Pseudomonas sp.]|nr:DNA-binding protein [Pseudomonas sp.]
MELELDIKTLLVAPPVMPWREFADWIRMSDGHDVVEAWIKRGYLPTVKIGRHRMVNVAQLVQSLLNEEEEV